MNSRGLNRASHLRVLIALVTLGLGACNGTALVTLTATPSTDTFLAYRVGLVSVELQANGKSTIKALPTNTTVDLANLADVSEVMSAASVATGNYTAVAITVDYSSADIVYDNGTVNGLTLTPVGTAGQAVGQVTLTLTLDPSDALIVTNGKTSWVALDFKLAASNVVNATAKTVTVTPMIVASSIAIDAKQVRIRGPLGNVNTASTSYQVGVTPFDFSVAEGGSLSITPSDVTTYEVNGTVSTGATGVTQLAGLSAGSMTATLGTLTSTASTTTTTTNGTTTTSTATDVSFSATQVLAGTSVQNPALDQVSGMVSARNGNTLTIEDATLIGIDGGNTFLPGTATVKVGANTVVTVVGQGVAQANTIAQISVGSSIRAFGTATTPTSGDVTLDASAGLVRLGLTSASGLVTAQGSGTLDLNLSSLGGRSLAAFDFVGTGSSTNASASAYAVSTGALNLANSTVGVPVEVTGFTTSFGAAPPDFTASTLLDPTTIQAQLVLDWGTGTAAPFTSYDTSAIAVNISNASIGARHEIMLGAEAINIVGLASDPLVIPDSSSSTLLFAIGHRASGTVENFNTYAAFITALQSELTGAVLATGMTAGGLYTASTYSFSATSITVVLDN